MPVSKLEMSKPGSGWGLWKVEETEPDLSYASFESCPDEIVHPQKRLEYLAGRALMKTLIEKSGLSYEGLRKDEFGKPFLKSHPHSISLSHSFPYVAAQISTSVTVGIDVEQVKEKLRQVGPRVLSPGEVEDAKDNLVKLCIYWCGKESLYKIYGRRNVLFTDHLRIDPFELASAGRLTGRIEVNGDLLNARLGYNVTKDYVLVYTEDMNP